MGAAGGRPHSRQANSPILPHLLARIQRHLVIALVTLVDVVAVIHAQQEPMGAQVAGNQLEEEASRRIAVCDGSTDRPALK